MKEEEEIYTEECHKKAIEQLTRVRSKIIYIDERVLQ